MDRTKTLTFAGLTVRIVDRSTAPDATTVVLLHGFGAPGDDLVSLAEVIDAPVRFVFPEAPLALGGMYGDARAWWPLDLERIEEELRRGGNRVVLRDEVPDGLADARTQMLALLDELAPQRLVLGGFSQGAMLALDLALHRTAPPHGLVLMSGTLVAAPVWQPRFPQLAGVPVLQSHGRADGLLPFGVAEVLRDKLRDAGASVEFHGFAGGHEIPMPVLAALTKFLRA